ncbi:MAG: patatin-like phospholipase family protein [Beijerinckiaceae bacterium]
MAQDPKRVSPFEQVVLLFQGGGALGAYQAGVFQALDEAKIQLDWLCGISIGAINAALIAGNLPERRVERLREFWEAVTKPPTTAFGLPWFSWEAAAKPPTGAYGLSWFSWEDLTKPPKDACGSPWFSDLPGATDERVLSWTKKMSAFANMVYGVPNFYSPRPTTFPGSGAEKLDQVSYYDVSPLKATLERLVDFDLINSRQMRLSVGATNVQTGASVYFDNSERKFTARHIMASGALPPAFPATEIDGEYYWDGGVVSNTPLQWLVDIRPRFSALVFQVDLWDARGAVPVDVAEANLRATEIHSASRINVSLDRFRKRQQTRNVLAELLELLPEERRKDPRIQTLMEEAGGKAATLIQLKYQTRKYETGAKLFEFSRRAMEEHWKAGYEDARVALNQPGILELPDPSETVRVFEVHKGWWP